MTTISKEIKSVIEYILWNTKYNDKRLLDRDIQIDILDNRSIHDGWHNIHGIYIPQIISGAEYIYDGLYLTEIIIECPSDAIKFIRQATICYPNIKKNIAWQIMQHKSVVTVPIPL